MLKLTSALMSKATEICWRINDELSLDHEDISDERSLNSRALSDRVVRGLLSLVTSEIIDDQHLTPALFKSESTHRESPLTRADLTSLYPSEQHLDEERRRALAYLRGLSLTESTQVFMAIETLVMRSGRGHTFLRWREAWRGALYWWLNHAERSRRARTTLAALLPLSVEHDQRWSDYQDDVSVYVHHLRSHTRTYLNASQRGESALSHQVALCVSGSLAGHLSRHTGFIQDTSSTQVEAQEETLTHHQHTFFTSARPLTPLSSLVRCLDHLFRLSATSSSEMRSQEVWTAPLLNTLIEGGSFPTPYLHTPPKSRRAWINQELRALLEHCPPHTSLEIWIDHAEHLTTAEIELWADLLNSAKSHHLPMVLIFLQHAHLQPDQHSTSLFLNSDQYVTSRAFDRSSIISRGLTYEEYKPPAHLTVEHPLEEWELVWGGRLMWGLSDRVHQRHELSELWVEGLGALSARHQRVLLDVVMREVSISALSPETHETLTELERAGWLTISGQTYTPRVDQLGQLLLLIIQHPHLRSTYTPALERALNETSSQKAESGSAHFREIAQDFHEINTFLDKVLERPLPSSSDALSEEHDDDLTLVTLPPAQDADDQERQRTQHRDQGQSSAKVTLGLKDLHRHIEASWWSQGEPSPHELASDDLNSEQISTLTTQRALLRHLAQFGVQVAQDADPEASSLRSIQDTRQDTESGAHTDLDYEIRPLSDLSQWGRSQLNILRGSSRPDDPSDFDLSITAIQETASTLGDLELLARAFHVQSRHQRQTGSLFAALESVVQAHQLWVRYGEYTQAKTCRMDLIGLLAQMGVPQVGMVLLSAEEEYTNATSSPSSSGSLTRLGDAQLLARSLTYAHLGDWVEVLNTAAFEDLDQYFSDHQSTLSPLSGRDGHSYDEVDLVIEVHLYQALAALFIAAPQLIENPEIPQDATRDIADQAKLLNFASKITSDVNAQPSMRYDLKMLTLWIDLVIKRLEGAVDDALLKALLTRLEESRAHREGSSVGDLYCLWSYRLIRASVLERSPQHNDEEDETLRPSDISSEAQRAHIMMKSEHMKDAEARGLKHSLDQLAHEIEDAIKEARQTAHKTRVKIHEQRHRMLNHLQNHIKSLDSWIPPHSHDSLRRSLRRFASNSQLISPRSWEDLISAEVK